MPDYTGPQPLQLPQTTKLEVPGVPESPSGVHKVIGTVVEDVTKMKRASRFRFYGGVGTVLTLLLGGGRYVSAQGETLETKHARLEEKHASLEEKQASTAKAVEVLVARVDAGEKAQVRTDLHMQRLEILVEMELDQHGVPKAKRPPKIEDPKGDEP